MLARQLIAVGYVFFACYISFHSVFSIHSHFLFTPSLRSRILPLAHAKALSTSTTTSLTFQQFRDRIIPLLPLPTSPSPSSTFATWFYIRKQVKYFNHTEEFSVRGLEWTWWVVPPRTYPSEENTLLWFRYLDENKDGVVSLDELEQVEIKMPLMITVALFPLIQFVNALEWSVALSSSASTRFSDVAYDRAGNVLALGSVRTGDDTITLFGPDKHPVGQLTRRNPYSGTQMFLLTYSPFGEILSSLSLVTRGPLSVATKLSVDSIGNAIVSGIYSRELSLFSNNDPTPFKVLPGLSGRYACFTLKLSPTSSVIWSTTVYTSTANIERCMTAVNTLDDSIYVSAQVPPGSELTIESSNNTVVSVLSHTVSCSILIKFSKTGSIEWFRTLTFATLGSLNSLDIDGNGEVVWVGSTIGTSQLFRYDSNHVLITSLEPSIQQDVFVLKLSQTGSLLWSTTISGDKSEEATSVAVDSQDNVLVTGQFTSSLVIAKSYDGLKSSQIIKKAVSDSDFGEYIGGFLVKYTSSGSLSWTLGQTFCVPADDKTYPSISVDKKSNNIALVSGTIRDLYYIGENMQETVAQREVGYDAYLIEYSSDGIFSSISPLASQGDDHLSRIFSQEDNGLAFVGTSSSTSLQLSSDDSWTISNGNVFSFLRHVNDKFVFLDFYQNIRNRICFVNANNARMSIHLNGVSKVTKKFPFSFTNDGAVTIACSRDICFVSINGVEYVTFDLCQFYVRFNDGDLDQLESSKTCMTLGHELGIVNPTGYLGNQTFKFTMEEQHGLLSDLPLEKVSNKSTVKSSFRLELIEKSFLFGVQTSSDLITFVFDKTGTIEVIIGSNSAKLALVFHFPSTFSVHIESSKLEFISGLEVLWDSRLANGTVERLVVSSKGKSMIEQFYLNIDDEKPATSSRSVYDSTFTTAPTNASSSNGPELISKKTILIFIGAGAIFLLVASVGTIIIVKRTRQTSQQTFKKIHESNQAISSSTQLANPNNYNNNNNWNNPLYATEQSVFNRASFYQSNF